MNDKPYKTNRYADGEDDGRVVADMSQVHAGLMDVIAPTGLREIFAGRRGPKPRGGAAQAAAAQAPAQPVDLTKGEMRALLKASLKAALALSGVFIAGGALFILFCIYVWFR